MAGVNIDALRREEDEEALLPVLSPLSPSPSTSRTTQSHNVLNSDSSFNIVVQLGRSVSLFGIVILYACYVKFTFGNRYNHIPK